MWKITEEKSLVTFQAYARSKIKKVLFILDWVTLATSTNIEFLRKVKCKYSIVVYLA